MSVLEIIQNLGIFSLFIAGIAWFFREIFKQILSRDLEKFKASLEKQVIKFRVQYERLHSERMVNYLKFI